LQDESNEPHLAQKRVKEVEVALLSKERYPFNLDTDGDLRGVIAKRTYLPILEWFEATFEDGYMKSEVRSCCDEPCEYFQTSNRQAELFSLNGYSAVRPVLASRCTICGKTYDFDGRSFGILNYNNRYLFTVELILDILEFKALSGTPTNTYWHARCNTLLKPWTEAESSALKKKWMNLSGRVHAIMTAYLALVDYPPNHFQCCKDPDVVCIDGIVLSVESRRIQNDTPWVDPVPIKGRFSKKEDRYIVVLKPDQKMLLRTFIRTGLYVEDVLGLAVELPDPFGCFFSHNYSLDPDNRYS
jgi:hypothetical protein